MRRTFVLGLFMLAAFAANANAQLPIQISLSGGATIPVRNEADTYENGIHVGIGAKLPLIPIQFEGAYDKLAGEGTSSDVKLLSGGVAVPFTITPPLLPVSAYLIAGGRLYRADFGDSDVTKFGLNGGAGVRFGIPGAFSLFGEGRGVVVFTDANKITYLTAAIGIRL